MYWQSWMISHQILKEWAAWPTRNCPFSLYILSNYQIERCKHLSLARKKRPNEIHPIFTEAWLTGWEWTDCTRREEEERWGCRRGRSRRWNGEPLSSPSPSSPSSHTGHTWEKRGKKTGNNSVRFYLGFEFLISHIRRPTSATRRWGRIRFIRR